VLVAAPLTEEKAAWAGGRADRLITIAAEPDALRRIIDAFRSNGGEGKPLVLQTQLSFASTDEVALAA
jgi:alkanesulfonate monooxygenase SsuD/methylene tetrahydromethanopterin reductase-like flavin-dependent oxidoreductase (luciferase family)